MKFFLKSIIYTIYTFTVQGIVFYVRLIQQLCYSYIIICEIGYYNKIDNTISIERDFFLNHNIMNTFKLKI